MTSIFLSHSHADKPFVRKLASDLANSGVKVWLDEAEILIGDSLIEKIGTGIETTAFVGAVLSTNSVGSRWVKKELEIALNEEIDGKRRKVLPILIEDCEIPNFLRGKLYADFRSPDSYYSEFNKLLKSLGISVESNKFFEPAMRGVSAKAISVSDSESERIGRDFKFYSPVIKPVKKGPMPKAGEKWRLDRTLPSGLLVSNRRNPKWWQQIFRSEAELEREDVRQLQYDIEKHLRENPNIFVQTRGTSSVAWHPTENLLVTAGDGIVAKLWDAETAELITRYPFYSTSPGRSISWSDDGDVFSVDDYLFDGRTGEALKGDDYGFLLGPGSYAYTPHAYASRRGMNDEGFPTTASTNFTPFRPNSSQYLLRDSEAGRASTSAINPWKPGPDQYGRCLVLRNRRTGGVEAIVDCASSPGIEDFAWHPNGQFIAVAFKRDNVKIIDLYNVRTVDSLSVPRLVGWDPTGRILVLGRTNSGNDLVVWDALETKEKPFPEEIRNETWFKRFSSNISADGLRYIKGVQIHSTESDEIIARLPIEHVTAAAWSPIDGGLLATSGSGLDNSDINTTSRFAVSPEGKRQSQTHIWRL